MSTQSVELTVNGETIRAEVEPRQHLGDFVRRELGLTGTHLSCEHGVCGACTVLVDGQPQRSCITFAVACGGAAITTIEGYGDDPVMAALRRAFHEHHALQCGYCTPGMLCTARDIVLRLPGPDARRVRHELAGNLCRCTGYVGIVEAIDSVLTQKAAGVLTLPVASTGAALSEATAGGTVNAEAAAALSAATATAAAAATSVTAATTANTAAATSASAASAPTASTVSTAPTTTATLPPAGDWPSIDIPTDGDWIEVRQSLTLPMSAQAAWQQLTDLPRVANCLPGAQITHQSGNRAEGVMNIKFGPITARFVMRAELDLDAVRQLGHLRAEGSDQRSATRVKTLLDYQVSAAAANQAKVDLQLRFRLAGPLAQFSRMGLVNDYVAEMTRLFGVNLARAVDVSALSASAGTGASGTRPMTSSGAALPAAGPSLLRLLWARLRRWLGLR